MVTGWRKGESAMEVDRGPAHCLAEVVNWALKAVLVQALRAIEAFELDTALSTERAAAVRYNMARAEELW